MLSHSHCIFSAPPFVHFSLEAGLRNDCFLLCVSGLAAKSTRQERRARESELWHQNDCILLCVSGLAAKSARQERRARESE